MIFKLQNFCNTFRKKSIDTKLKKIDNRIIKIHCEIERLIIYKKNSIEIQRIIIIEAKKQILLLEAELLKIQNINNSSVEFEEMDDFDEIL